jgi:hypothetical protein
MFYYKYTPAVFGIYFYLKNILYMKFKFHWMSPIFLFDNPTPHIIAMVYRKLIFIFCLVTASHLLSGLSLQRNSSSFVI